MKIIDTILVLAMSCLLCISVNAASPNIRVGLDTKTSEWVAILDGGGEVQNLEGKPLLCLKDGEKLRIWLDNSGDTNPINEFRIQVGPPLTLEKADKIIRKLQALGSANQPEKIAVPDGGSWRIVLGHYNDPKDTTAVLTKLRALGYQELVITNETLANSPSKNRALYAITEHYERYLLPDNGIRLVSAKSLVTMLGKGRYRGLVEIFPNTNGKLSAVNIVDLENYLRGVVPMEMSSSNFPELEALKAQAVAARTYAFTNLGKRAKCGFDLLDTISDQVYGGRDKEQELTNRAVMETAGLIATYDGLPIQALFMANAGGATVDNSFVFGGTCNYLKEASNYVKEPQTVTFTSTLGSREGSWITWEILRLVGTGLLPSSYLETSLMCSQARASELYPVMKSLALRLGRPNPSVPNENGPSLYLWIGRTLGFQHIVDGIERHQDALYLLGEAAPTIQDDKLLASFLTRKGLVSPTAWRDRNPTLEQMLQVLGKLWYELEPIDFIEGTLLRNGEVRVKNCSSSIIIPRITSLLVEEAPGGSLRLVTKSDVQVGDRVKWLTNPNEGFSILIRRLDPNGAAINRYSPTAHWKTELKEADLLAALRAKANVQSLKDIKLTHNNQGRVVQLDVIDDLGQNHQFTGMRIRNLLGLRDNMFRVITLGSKPSRRWVIYGRGWGHGVGMDQTGAYGMALEGSSFKEILQHYYQGIQFTTIGG